MQEVKSTDPVFVLSVVIPIFCEEESIPTLMKRVAEAVDPLNLIYEVILVDDGSSDKSVEEIAKLEAQHQNVRGVYLARNYGQTTALQAGFDHARGEYIVTLDGDLQNDPADIPRLLKLLQESNADVISGWRRNRQDDPLRMAFSRVANRFISSVTGVRLNDYGCTLKVYRRDILDQIRIYGEMHRFLPAVAAEVGARVVETEVTHHPRQFGKSKYGLDRTFRVLLDLLLIRFLHKYVHRPLHFFGGTGLAFLGGGFLISFWLAFQKLAWGESIGSRPLLLLGVFMMLVGVVLISQGLIGEMTSRLMFETTNRKQYRLRPERLRPQPFGK